MNQTTNDTGLPRPAGDFADSDDPFALFSVWLEEAGGA